MGYSFATVAKSFVMPKKITETLPAAALVSYRIEIAEPNTHLFHVTLTIAQPAARQRLTLPVWIPGSYLIREFAKNLSRLHARAPACVRWRAASLTNAAGKSTVRRPNRWW